MTNMIKFWCSTESMSIASQHFRNLKHLDEVRFTTFIFCRDLETCRKIYQKFKHDPPVQRNLPPVSLKSVVTFTWLDYSWYNSPAGCWQDHMVQAIISSHSRANESFSKISRSSQGTGAIFFIDGHVAHRYSFIVFNFNRLYLLECFCVWLAFKLFYSRVEVCWSMFSLLVSHVVRVMKRRGSFGISTRWLLCWSNLRYLKFLLCHCMLLCELKYYFWLGSVSSRVDAGCWVGS